MNIDRVEIKECGNKVIKATIYGCKYDAIDKLNRKFIAPSTSDISFAATWKNDNGYLMRNSYSAIARCDKEDTYDFEVGKRIATKKLAEKYNKAIDRRMAKFLIHMNKALESMDKYFDGRTF
jgi:hypothetical protein